MSSYISVARKPKKYRSKGKWSLLREWMSSFEVTGIYAYACLDIQRTKRELVCLLFIEPHSAYARSHVYQPWLASLTSPSISRDGADQWSVEDALPIGDFLTFLPILRHRLHGVYLYICDLQNNLPLLQMTLPTWVSASRYWAYPILSRYQSIPGLASQIGYLYGLWKRISLSWSFDSSQENAPKSAGSLIDIGSFVTAWSGSLNM